MLINVETKLNTDFATVVKYVNLSATLDYIASPLLVFEPVDPKSYPKIWRHGDYLVRMKVFGIILLGTQYIRIERIRDKSATEFILRDNGSGQLAKRWDHWIFIEKTEKNRVTRYVDRIEVKAGLLTPGVALFAAIFYRWRQHRWRKLIKNGFAPLKSHEVNKRDRTSQKSGKRR